MIVINPGTEPIEGTAVKYAFENMEHLITDIKIDGLEFIRYEKNDYGDGRYCFVLMNLRKGVCCEIQMPGLRLSKVRFMNEPDQDMALFPRLYVDGSSWHWFVALNVIRHIFKKRKEQEE